jgi:aldehyde:ferredoxin oxidoreductase
MHKWFFVDLSDRRVWEEDFEEPVLRKYLGGYGLGARVLYDRMPGGVDPLGPDNILGLMAGPLTGTPTITGNRFMALGKSPLTGTWGDANCGGRFGPYLKFAGCDGLFVRGISEEPVILLIREGSAEIRSAAGLWGKNAQETESALKAEFGDAAEIACIGTAGEKMSLVSCILNQYGRAAGRCGLGAVMGSKKLKAVVATGKQEVPVHDRGLAANLRRQYVKMTGGAYPLLSKIGSGAFSGINLNCGDSPVKNWAGSVPYDFSNEAVTAIDGDALVQLQNRKWGCWMCPISCGGHMKPYAKQKASVSHKPEYETVIALGSLCLNQDIESIMAVNDICNDYGVDTISMGGIVAFALECYENGLISRSDAGGLDLRWGNADAIVELSELVARREGIGEVLADGVRVAARKIGGGSERFAVHVGGQEPGMHDPKFAPGQAVAHQMDSAPGRHTPITEGLMPQCQSDFLPSVDKRDYGSAVQGNNRRWLLSYYHAWSALGVCMYGYLSYPAQFIPDFAAAITGWDVDIDELAETGERIANLRHVFNLREGLNPLDFKVHDRMMGMPPLPEGEVAGVSVDCDAMNRALLEAMDWDPVTTRPSERKLAALGLEDLIEDVRTMGDSVSAGGIK